ncbi:hypothetical protein PENTCL1PPCAC_19066, partial [Pristionchus entomophagus]
SSQEAGAFVQAPLASVQQPQLSQYFFPQQQLQQQQYVQYQKIMRENYREVNNLHLGTILVTEPSPFQPQAQTQQFYYPQKLQQQQQQTFYYPYQPYQQLQYAPVQPVQPAFEMSPKLTIPTGLLRHHINTSSDEPSVFAMSYNPETGVKVATINGRKVFAYKQRFPGAPKESVEIVENGDVNTSGNPVVVRPSNVASTTENDKGEKTKNVWFDDKDDPMVKIEKEPVAGAAVSTTTVDPNLPVVSQDGDESTTTAATSTTTEAAATTTAAIASDVVTVTPVPAAAAADATTTTAIPVTAAAAAVGVVSTTPAAPGIYPVPTTTPLVPGEAFFAAQNPLYAANVAAFSARYPQYFPTRFAAKGYQVPEIGTISEPRRNHGTNFPVQVTPVPVVAGASGMSQVHPVYAQSAISTTAPVSQAFPQYVAAQQPLAVPQVPQFSLNAQYLQSTALPVAAAQQQYLSTLPVPISPALSFSPVPQQYLQPVQQPQQINQRLQFVQQPQQQQYLQPTTPQPVPQYAQPTAQPQYLPQPQVTQQPQQQYLQPVQHQQQYQQPRYPAPAAPVHQQVSLQ